MQNWKGLQSWSNQTQVTTLWVAESSIWTQFYQMLTRKLYLLSGTVSQKKGEVLNCHVLLPAACLVPPASPVQALYYSPRWINMSLPGNGFTPSCLKYSSTHLKHLLATLRGLNGNLISLLKSWCQTAGKTGITCLISPLQTCMA